MLQKGIMILPKMKKNAQLKGAESEGPAIRKRERSKLIKPSLLMSYFGKGGKESVISLNEKKCKSHQKSEAVSVVKLIIRPPKAPSKRSAH